MPIVKRTPVSTWLGLLFFEDLVAKANAVIADVDARPRDQPACLAARLPAERAPQRSAHLGACPRFRMTPA